MINDDRSSYRHYREAVYARLNRYTVALDSSDDRMVAIIARAELPRYVRYWVTLLAKHEATSQREVPHLFPMVARGLRALWYVEVGARILDYRTSENHGAIEPDKRRNACRAGSDPVGCYVSQKP